MLVELFLPNQITRNRVQGVGIGFIVSNEYDRPIPDLSYYRSRPY